MNYEVTMSGFCQFKTAYLIASGFENLTNAICEDDIFGIVDQDELPDGWVFNETAISGAAGFLMIFDIESIPTQADMDQVDAYLKKLEKEYEHD